jgi:hypothetical protein
MKDSKVYSINEKEVENIEKIYDRLKILNTNKQLGNEESENLLKQILYSFGFKVQDGVILSLLNPKFTENTVSLFSSKSNGILDILMTIKQPTKKSESR